MISVTSTFAATIQSLARANGPYTVDAGAPLTFTGGPDHASTSFAWDLGDTTTAAGRIVGHTYPRAGVYAVRLRTVVGQPGGVTTDELAKVIVRNTPPVVTAPAALSVDEGTPLAVTVTFTDQGWLDTHRALFTWGDDTPSEWGTVSEQHDPPRAQGTATATHAWCDSGQYTITVEVFDDNGGRGTATIPIEVRNVAPTVDAGPEMFAYPCVPLTLTGRFTDPGWCDTHTATWDWGDCDPPQPAVVHERHDPPAGTGVVVATHTYEHCGTYVATCTVVDDDGGVGRDRTIIHAVHLRNADFEHGFHRNAHGEVANDWAVLPTAKGDAVGQAQYDGEQFVVHDGQRSQRVEGSGRFVTRLAQRIGANPGWQYQVTAWYHLAPSGGRCRLGLDAGGGADPDGAGVEWAAGDRQGNWAQLCTRVTATGAAVTIFLETSGGPLGTDERTTAWFDDVVLSPAPCCIEPEEPPAPEPPTTTRRCLSWPDRREPSREPPKFEQDGFGVAARQADALQIVTFGQPPATGKLLVPPGGVTIVLPAPAVEIVATVVVSKGLKITARAGATVVDSREVFPPATPQAVSISGTGITAVDLDGADHELLVELCAVFVSGPSSGPPYHTHLPPGAARAVDHEES